jgi:hypothetical protein
MDSWPSLASRQHRGAIAFSGSAMSSISPPLCAGKASFRHVPPIKRRHSVALSIVHVGCCLRLLMRGSIGEHSGTHCSLLYSWWGDNETQAGNQNEGGIDTIAVHPHKFRVRPGDNLARDTRKNKLSRSAAIPIRTTSLFRMIAATIK